MSLNVDFQFTRSAAGSTATDGWLNFRNDSYQVGPNYIATQAIISISELRSASSAFTGECWTSISMSDGSEYNLGGITGSFPASSVSSGATISGTINLSSMPTWQRLALATKTVTGFNIERSSYGGGKDIRCNASSVATVTLVYEDYYTSVKAPTAVNLNKTYAKAGTSATLSWSGAQAGTYNAIAGYMILENGVAVASVESTSTSGSYTVTAPGAGGSAIYTVATIGVRNTSGESTASASLFGYGDALPPGTVTVSNSMPNPGETVVLSWSGAQAGDYNAITGFKIYRATAEAGEYALIDTITSAAASGSTEVDAPPTAGVYYWFKIATAGANEDSALSAAVRIGANAAPASPTIVGSSTIYNPRPRMLITVGADSAGELQTLQASGWTLSRSSGLNGGDHVLARKTTAMTAAGQATMELTQTDPYSATSTASSTATVAAVSWTDNPVQAGGTVIKAAHINELRSCLDAICLYYGIELTEWAEEIIAHVTPDINFPAHIAEIIATINRIAAYVNAWDGTTATNDITLPNIPQSARPAAATINTLRSIISLL